MAGKSRLVIALGVVLAALALSAAILFAHGQIHSDEPMCADTAINVLDHRGFVNNAHDQRPPDVPGAVLQSMPAHTVGLTGWLALFVTSRHAVISFNVVIYAIAAAILAMTARRLQLISGPAATMALPILFFCHPSSVFVYSINRYDSLGCPLLLVAFAALFIKRAFVRACALAVIACLLPVVGLHVALAGCILGILAAVGTIWWGPTSGSRLFVQCIAFAAITVAASLLLIAAARAQGGLDPRVAQVTRLENFAISPAVVAQAVNGAVFGRKDFSPFSTGIFPLIIALILFVGYAALYLRNDSRLQQTFRLAAAGLAVNFAVSLAIGFLGLYYHRYTWMVMPALLLATVACVAGSGLPKILRVVGSLAAFIAVVPGLPASVFASAIEWPELTYGHVHSFVSRHITPSDVVYAGSSAYYPVKLNAEASYFGPAFKFMTPEKLRQVDVLILEYPRNVALEPTDENVFDKVGGQWDLIDELIVPRSALRRALPRPPAVDTTWHLKVIRRLK